MPSAIGLRPLITRSCSSSPATIEMKPWATRTRNYVISVACAVVTVIVGAELLRARENRVETPTGFVERHIETVGQLMDEQNNGSLGTLRDYFSMYVSLHVYTGVFGVVVYESLYYDIVPAIACALFSVLSALLMVDSDWSSALVLEPPYRISVSAWDPSLLFTPSAAMLALSTHIFCTRTDRWWERGFYISHAIVYCLVLIAQRQATFVSLCNGLSAMGCIVGCLRWWWPRVPPKSDLVVAGDDFSIDDDALFGDSRASASTHQIEDDSGTGLTDVDSDDENRMIENEEKRKKKAEEDALQRMRDDVSAILSAEPPPPPSTPQDAPELESDDEKRSELP